MGRYGPREAFSSEGEIDQAVLSRLVPRGRSNALRQQGGSNSHQLFGLPRWAIFRLFQKQLVSWCLSPVKSSAWFEAFREANILLGYLQESLHHRQVNSEQFPLDAAIPGNVPP